ncbi:hypothetical protein M1373_00795 [Candidatus Marsarchaeota archaeon]|nr:hypothetical protein [Candidatus Marsarchaeota archaeon]MCL5404383.1 hypothetical protein [Candidatus Marsarchaeota archaeon]
MEYLMTYGWAILIIAIVLAALFSLGVFSSASLVGTTCLPNSGFLCSGPVAHGTTFTAIIGQATGAAWSNVVLCFVPNSATAPSSCAGYPSVNVGDMRSGMSGTYSFTIDSSSSTADGHIWAQYDEASYSNLLSQIATVTIAGLTPSSATVTTSTSFALPSGITNYANVVITNSQGTATPAPFQQEVQIPESDYSSYLAYNGNAANFEFFYDGGAIIPAWIESNNSGTITAWLKLQNGIPANSAITIYLGFAPKTTNLLSSSGTTGIGEAPALSGTYGEYDDGASVFLNYFSGDSLSGLTAVGTAGQTDSAPSGSPFGTEALYALNYGGNYLYGLADGQSTNMIIEYYTYIIRLNDVFFLESSGGSGQLSRQGYGTGWYGIAGTSSWTTWDAPPDTGTWDNEWVLSGVIVDNGIATEYLSTTLGNYGSEFYQNPSNEYTVANNGEYLGFVGDGGGTEDEYWNGLIIRAYPPGGVMPSASLGSVS